MAKPCTLLQLLCTLSALTTVGWGLHLGAFNAHRFGRSKADKPEVMDILAKIAIRYDILLVQEITDITGQAILKLLQKIEMDYGVTMKMSISDRVGRTSAKEQYAFLYREDRGLSVVDSLHFEDGDEASQNDAFQREPYIVRFRASRCSVQDFTLVALHTMPTRTVEELKALTPVVRHVREAWSTDNIMVLGDLNADCSYVPKKHWPHIELRHDPRFWWAIGDDADTTVNTNTDCAYDRFIISGGDLRNAVVAGSVQIFDFGAEYGLSPEQTMAVSDHYPIELRLQDRSGTQRQMNRDVNSQASAARSVMETLKHAWHTVKKRFTRFRSEL